MVTKVVKIPEKIFVTAKLVKEHVGGEYTPGAPDNGYIYEEHVFGFLHPHEPTKKADDSRKETQINWAYSGEVYKIGDQYWHRGTDYVFDPITRSNSRVPFDRLIDPVYAPRVWDNVPLTGFKIIDTVNRYRGNKLFKVLDPRGVEFEITVAALFEILMSGTVSKGEILSHCVWKANKNLVVVK